MYLFIYSIAIVPHSLLAISMLLRPAFSCLSCIRLTFIGLKNSSYDDYLPNAAMIATPVGAWIFPVFGLDPGYTAEKLVVVWKYSQPVYRVHHFLDNGRSFTFWCFRHVYPENELKRKTSFDRRMVKRREVRWSNA